MGGFLSRYMQVSTGHVPPRWMSDVVQNRGGFGLRGNLHDFVSLLV